MLVASQRHISQVQKDVLATKEKKYFLLSPTVNLFGTEMRVAEMLTVSKTSLSLRHPN